MTSRLTALTDKLTALAKLHSTMMDKLSSTKGSNGAQFDFTKQSPGIDRPFFEIHARIVAILALASSLQGSDNDILVPQSLIASLTKYLDATTTVFQSIVDQLNQVDANGGPGNLDPETATLNSANGQTTLQLAPLFQNVWNHSEHILTAFFPLLNIVQGKGSLDFGEGLRAFTLALEQVHKLRASLAEIQNSALSDSKKASELFSQFGGMRQELERLKAEGEKDRKTLSEYTGESTQAVSAIRSTSEQAEKLRASIEAYAPLFDSFQKQLDQREHLMQQGSEQQQALLKRATEFETRISKLNEQAEAMLSGATVAGLAGSFGKIRDDLSVELKKARRAFYVAIALLFASVMPLAAYIIPGFGDLISSATVQSHGQLASTSELIGQILARALLLLPSAWFAKFAAGRHAALFKLKEHYAYKYSVASSVESFKRQAEPFKDAIAATTFFELTFNPAERMDSKGHEDRHPNPVMDWVMKKLGTTYDGK